VVFGVLLYINAPLALEIVDEAQVLSAKSVNAVVPERVGSTLVNVFPPAVYAVPVTSLLVVYAVVAAVKVALLVYIATFTVSPLKSWHPYKSSFLKVLHIKFPSKAI
jgi:hypothetical protein